MSQDLRVSHLRCEYLVNPLGIDERLPRLSWQLESGRRGARQIDYQIRVASAAELLASGKSDFWDSGKVQSSQTTHVAYAGQPLASRQMCYWSVEVWDETGARVQSAPAFWSMGLLEKSDWSAKWIAADPEIIRRDKEAIAPTLTEPGTPGLFRKEFEIPMPIIRATVYASARGIFELRANGRRIGKDLFAPEWTDYDKRVQYRTYDVTALLTQGRNALGATLGDGWWSGYVGWQETRCRYGSLTNSFALQLEVELVDGKRLTFATDQSWQCETGPIITSDFMMGETYDARRERIDWDRPDFKISNSKSHISAPWLPAQEVPAPTAPLVAQRAEPVRITELLTSVSLNEIKPGVWIYDLAQNISGWARLKLPPLPAGTKIVVRHGERLSPDGTLYTENLRRAKATDTYIVRGDSHGETYEPHFTFHGFQYLELTAYSTDNGHLLDDKFRPDLATVTGCVIHSATPLAGHFECSNAEVNRLWLNGVWSQRDNFLSVPTDCPQRDERLGWMGDAQVFLRTASYNMDVAAFFTKWMVDVEDAQTPDGLFPDTAPRLREGKNFVGLDDLCGGAGWADAGVIIPHTIWKVYGDTRIIERHWNAMTAWLAYLDRTNPDGLRTRDLRNNYGDWLCIPSDREFRTHSPMKNLLATAYWADDAAKMAAMARAVGRDAEAAGFTAMFEKVRTAFQKEFVLADGRMTVETQTAYLLALAFDLLPKNLRAPAADHLVKNIADLDWHLSTGFVGISHLNPQLTLAGRSDVAYRLLLQDTYPSWLYPVKHGATTIWERWNGWTEKDGFFHPLMNSFNHYSLGSVGEWLFRHVAGIELDPEKPGFQHFILRPYLGAGLSYARATYRTMHGEIESAWKLDGEKFTWSIRIPANCTAIVYLPHTADAEPSMDGLRPLPGDQFVLFAPAGSYTLSSVVQL
ncbi:MAG: family 78 glycoside hydrolase catalytic domain [Nibricoccus sp.]